jgi:phosphoglycerate dehydrogenase-like enzyme
MNAKPTIIVTEGLEKVPFDWLRQNANVIEISWKEPDRLHAALKDADALIVRTYTLVTPALLAHAPRLKAVGRAGVGLDNIDQPACAARGIEVISTPTANTRAVCEYVFNLIFTLARPVVNLKEPISDSEFHTYRKVIRGLELSGKTMAILGMGRIGRGVGKIAWAMEMNVIYNDLVDVSGQIDYPAQSVDKQTLYREADILTLHVNHQPNNLNTHLINAAALGQMKPTAILVNTCRGEVVDADALAAALKFNRLAGACLDVHEPEPPPPDYPLWRVPNLVFAPHLAARTQGAMDRMSWVARDVVEYLQAKRPGVPTPGPSK